MVDQSDGQRRWRKLLDEDVPSPTEAQVLLPLLARLRGRLPGDEGRKARLLESLAAGAAAQLPLSPRQHDTWWPLLLLQQQVRVVQREALLVSALIFALGALVTALLSIPADAISSLPIVLLAPLAAAAGTALIYNDQVAQAMAVEQSTPVPVQVILLARLLLIFCLDCALALVGSAVLAFASPHLTFWPLVLSWLAPMTFLSMLAFLLSVLSKDSLVGIVVSMTLWTLLSVGRAASADVPWLARLPDLASAAARPWLFTLALACVVAALWLAGRVGRTAGGMA
jgi:hypothetical protein